MFDDQKISAHDFILGYREGLYVCVQDSCQLCQDYKRDIEKFESHYLKIVEVATDEQRRAIYDLSGRSAFPITMGFWQNELKFVKLGQLFGDDLTDALKFLDLFPKEPRTPEELAVLQKRSSKRFKLTYCIFPKGTASEDRISSANGSYEREEICIDIDEHPGLPADVDQRLEALSGLLRCGAKLAIFDIFRADEYSETGTRMIQRLMEDRDYGADAVIEHRTIQKAAEDR